MSGKWSSGLSREYALVALWIDGRLDFGCYVGHTLDHPVGWRWASEASR